jgi:cold shock CspA family protein
VIAVALVTDGTITRLVKRKGLGVVRSKAGLEYVFHRSEAPGFEDLQEGDLVTFTPGDAAAKGPARASGVQRMAG